MSRKKKINIEKLYKNCVCARARESERKKRESSGKMYKNTKIVYKYQELQKSSSLINSLKINKRGRFFFIIIHHAEFKIFKLLR